MRVSTRGASVFVSALLLALAVMFVPAVGTAYADEAVLLGQEIAEQHCEVPFDLDVQDITEVKELTVQDVRETGEFTEASLDDTLLVSEQIPAEFEAGVAEDDAAEDGTAEDTSAFNAAADATCPEDKALQDSESEPVEDGQPILETNNQADPDVVSTVQLDMGTSAHTTGEHTDETVREGEQQTEADTAKGIQGALAGTWDVLALKMVANPVLGAKVFISPTTTGDIQGVAFRYTIEVNEGKDVTLLRRYKRGVPDLDFMLQRSGTVVVKLEARDYKGKVKYLQCTLKVPTPAWSLGVLKPDYQADGATAFVPQLSGDTRYLRYRYTWESATGSGKSGTIGYAKEGSSKPFKAQPGAYDISLDVVGTDGTIKSARLSYLAGETRGIYNLEVSQSGTSRGSSAMTAKASGKDEHGHALSFDYHLVDDLGRTYAKGSGTSASLVIPHAVGPFSVVVQPKAHGNVLASIRKPVSMPSVISGMKMFMQKPELPTGCESVALGIALSGYGFNISKTTIAKSYLPYGSNFVTTYVGNPWGAGSGIYAPGLVNTARAYLSAHNSQMQVHNLTGASANTLYSYIDKGIPVVVWNTMGNSYPKNAGYGAYYSGTYYPWFYNEHCLVLAGYNSSKTSVLVYDPLVGKVWRNANTFFRNYRVMGSMAMAIR